MNSAAVIGPAAFFFFAIRYLIYSGMNFSLMSPRSITSYSGLDSLVSLRT
jgi:hypothetical protein